MASFHNSFGKRQNWSDQETWVLIRLWEDNMKDLKAQKRNMKIYQKITDEMINMGVYRNVKQVHMKMDNLTQAYRRAAMAWRSGSKRATKWPFFYELHRILGGYHGDDGPLNDDGGGGSKHNHQSVNSGGGQQQQQHHHHQWENVKFKVEMDDDIEVLGPPTEPMVVISEGHAAHLRLGSDDEDDDEEDISSSCSLSSIDNINNSNNKNKNGNNNKALNGQAAASKVLVEGGVGKMKGHKSDWLRDFVYQQRQSMQRSEKQWEEMLTLMREKVELERRSVQLEQQLLDVIKNVLKRLQCNSDGGSGGTRVGQATPNGHVP